MTRILYVIVTRINVLIGVPLLGAIEKAAWLACGIFGLAIVGVVATAVALAWPAAQRAGEVARRQSALQEERQVALQVQRKEPWMAVPRRTAAREPLSSHDDSVITVMESGIPAP